MDRSKIVAIITGVIAVVLSVAYLVMVQILDFRGMMMPAPQSFLLPTETVALLPWISGIQGQ
jgi:hypothetical protein